MSVAAFQHVKYFVAHFGLKSVFWYSKAEISENHNLNNNS